MMRHWALAEADKMSQAYMRLEKTVGALAGPVSRSPICTLDSGLKHYQVQGAVGPDSWINDEPAPISEIRLGYSNSIIKLPQVEGTLQRYYATG
jgi:hypothetical protein